MDSSWIGWHQGEASSIISLLVATSLGSVFLWSAVSIWRGLLPAKATQECVSGLYLELSGNWEFSDSAKGQN